MIKLLRFISVILLFIGVGNKATASHMMGADITYKCVSDKKFNVTIKFYRDCKGIPFNNPSGTVKCVSGGSGSVNVTSSLIRTSIRDITPICASGGKRCNPSNTTVGNEGIEEHTFVFTIDLNSAQYASIKNCCILQIETGQCCRNSAITTGASNANFYTFAEINVCAVPCNSSPSLTTEAVAYLCCDQPFFYNNGASDTTDNDSLSYRWANPLSASGANIGYVSPLSWKRPFTAYWPSGVSYPKVDPDKKPPWGIYLDSITGDIVLTPVKCDEVTVAVLEVKEWRKDATGKYVHIGTTRRDLQFVVRNCLGNNPPQINGPYSYEVCAGSRICFDVTTKDDPYKPPPPASIPDPDTVNIKWNKGIPGATFTVKNPKALWQTGEFCWTTREDQANELPYTFTVTARDNACPLNAVTVKSFRITVKQRANTKTKVETLTCGKYTVQSNVVAGFKGTPKYDWEIWDIKGIPILRTVGYFLSTKNPFSFAQKDTIQFRTGGTYIVRHSIDNPPLNCPKEYYDTIIVPPLLEADLAFGPDTFVCAGTKVTLKPKVINGVMPVKYQWSTPIYKSEKDTLSTFTITPVKDTSIAVLITDKNQCKAWDTTRIWMKPNPKVDLGPDIRLCFTDSFKLVPKFDTAYWKYPNETTSKRQGTELIKTWKFNGSFISNYEHVWIKKNQGKYSLRIVDSVGCSNTDSMIAYVNTELKPNAGTDQIVCWDSLVTIKASGIDTFGNGKRGYYNWYDISTNPPLKIDFGRNNQLNFKAKNNITFQLLMSQSEDTVTCIKMDTIKMSVVPLPIITMPLPITACCADPNISLNAASPSVKPGGGVWSYPTNPSLVMFGNTFVTKSACVTGKKSFYRVHYRYKDPATQCANRDSVIVTVNPLPDVLVSDGYYCQYKDSVDLLGHVKLPTIVSTGIQTWSCYKCGTYKESDIIVKRGDPFNPIFRLLINESKFNMGAKQKDSIELVYTFLNSDGCFSRDTAKFIVVKIPKITFIPMSPVCNDAPPVALKKASNVFPTDGSWKCRDSIGLTPCSNLFISNDTIYPTKSKPGLYKIRYTHTSTGCPVNRDTLFRIHPLPTVTISKSPNDDIVCENHSPIDLISFPSGGIWTGSGINGNQFIPSQGNIGANKLRYSFTNPVTGCKGRDSLSISVQPLPTVTILNGDRDTCRKNNQQIQIKASFSNSPKITWYVVGNATIVNNIANPVTLNLNANNDSTNKVILIVQTDEVGVCPFVDDVTEIRIHPIPNASISTDKYNGCSPIEPNFKSVVLNKIDTTLSNYLWNFGDGNTSILKNDQNKFTTPGSYKVYLKITSDKSCDTTMGPINIDVYPNPIADFDPDPNNKTTTALPRFKFNNMSKVSGVLNSSVVYNLWTFGTGDTTNQYSPTKYYSSDTGTYNVRLVVKTNHGCLDTVTKSVIIGPDIIVYIPNAYSPNNSGPSKNNKFRVVASGYKDFNIFVFNRWGEILYTSNDINEGWDGRYLGKECQQDVYVYQVNMVSWSDEIYKYNGTITLIR